MSQPPGPPPWPGPPSGYEPPSYGPSGYPVPPPPGPVRWPGPPPPGWGGPPPRKVPVLPIVLAAVVVVVVNAVALAFLFAGPAAFWPGPDPTAGPAVSPSPADLGPLGRELTAAGFSCTLELADPLISGCYSRSSSGSRSLRWQGPGDRPTALTSYVYSDSTGYGFATELAAVLAGLQRSGIWTADDLAAVQAQSRLRDGQTADVDTSWGRVTLSASKYSMLLTGSRPGETARLVTAKTFPTPMAGLEGTATTLGYRCERSTSAPGENSTCTDPQGNYLSISAYDGPAVESLYGSFKTPAGPQTFVDLVEAATPADAAALSGLIIEGATTTTLSYRAANGWIVVCTKRDTVSCSVYGVSWE